VLGLGAGKLEWVEVRWPPPSRRVERFADLKMGAYQKIVEGTGRPI